MHFNFRDKSIFISGYGTLDAKRVSRVIVDGDHLDVTTSNITHSWSSNVSLYMSHGPVLIDPMTQVH